MDAGDWAWVAIIGGALITDGVLSKTHSQLLTDSARKRWPITITIGGLFALHLLDVLGPLDPFRLLGRLLNII